MKKNSGILMQDQKKVFKHIFKIQCIKKVKKKKETYSLSKAM